MTIVPAFKQRVADDRHMHWVLLPFEDPSWLPWLVAAAVSLLELDANCNPNPTVDIPSARTIRMAVSFSAPDLSILPSPRSHSVSLQFQSYYVADEWTQMPLPPDGHLEVSEPVHWAGFSRCSTEYPALAWLQLRPNREPDTPAYYQE
jgi:hypothetical protein